MSIREEVKQQQDKMKDKDFKAKWDYFWDYYKFHVMTAVVALIFIISGIKNMVNEKPTFLSVILVNSTPASLENTMAEDFMETIGVDPTENVCFVDTTAVLNPDNIDQVAVATTQKITANIAAKELDVLGADYNTFFQYAGQDVFADLSAYYSKEDLDAMGDNVLYMDAGYIEYIASDEYQDYLTNGTFDKSNKYAVLCDDAAKTGNYTNLPKEEMKNPVPVGIIINNSKAYEKTGMYSGKTSVVGIIANSTRTEAAVKFLDYIYQN